MNLAIYDLPADSRIHNKLWQPGRVVWARPFARTIRVWRARIRERRESVELSDRDLCEVGLSRWEVEYERTKPFWWE